MSERAVAVMEMKLDIYLSSLQLVSLISGYLDSSAS